MKRRQFVATLAGLFALHRAAQAAPADSAKIEKLVLKPEEWKKRLTPEQYAVLREEGTERAGSSPLDREKRKGTFACAGCDLPLFTSDMKYDSGTSGSAFSFRIGEGTSVHQPWCSFMLGALYCSCGSDINGLEGPLYEWADEY